MNCPVCGWIDGYYHAAGHTYGDWRRKEGTTGEPPGGLWRPVPTSRELFALVGCCLRRGDPFEGTED